MNAANLARSAMVLFGMLPLLPAPSVPAQETAAPYQPKLVNSKNGEHHDFPMGVLSATGRLIDGDREILVMDVGTGGAADKGGLKVGDRIVTIAGKKARAFSTTTDSGVTGPQLDLALALDAACGANAKELEIEVRRGSEELALTISVPGAPRFADSFPENCAKSAALAAGITKHLLATQREDGSWKPGVGGDADVYMTAFCGLALLAADEPEHLSAIESAIGFLNHKSTSKIEPGNPSSGPKNWQAATTAILLAEYQLATGDDAYFADLAKSCAFLASRVTDNGTMGHHLAIPYNGGGLVIINVQAHLAWALAERCGYEIDGEAWERSWNEVEASIDSKTGAVGYSARAPGSPDIAARTGAMAAALVIAGKERQQAGKFADALVDHQGRMRHAHAMCSIGLIYGFAGIKTADPPDHEKVLNQWKPFLELSRNTAGSASYFGGKRNIGGDQYLGLDPIGNATVALVLASAEGKLFLHGGTEMKWFGKGR